MSRGDLPPTETAAGKRIDGLATDTRQFFPKNLRLNPADKVAIAYLLLLALLITIFSFRIDWWIFLLLGHALAIAMVLLVAGWKTANTPSSVATPSAGFARFVRGWYPVALIPITYKELSYLIPLIHPRDFDAALAAIDRRFLGVNPTVWLERFTWPPLTEALQLIYSSYYLLPIILGVVLWRSERFEEFHFWVFIVVVGFYLSYLGYIAVPAIGPRFLPEIVQAQTQPLTGVWLFHSLRAALDRAEGITRDCFPSGHTEITLLVLYYTRRFHRNTFWCLLPIGTGIVISTVYLRYHYVIDVVAGALLTAAIVATAKPLYRFFGGRDSAKTF